MVNLIMKEKVTLSIMKVTVGMMSQPSPRPHPISKVTPAIQITANMWVWV